MDTAVEIPWKVRQAHEAKLAKITDQLRRRVSTKPLSLKKKAVSHQVPKNGDRKYSDDKLDVTALTEVLHIDPVRRLCVAESGVTFVDLVRETMKYGLAPIIVPELKTITIGGAVSGCSIESMSFQYGGFHDTCVAYELITAKGEVLQCTPDNEHALLFQMVHGSFGTLGILGALTLRLVPAKPFVKLIYEKHLSLEAYLAAIKAHAAARDVDFMDGIIHGPKEFVLSLGHYVEDAPYTSDYSWMKIYFESTKHRAVDYLRTPDYFFRYDRGVTKVRPSSFLGRLLLGKFLASSEILRLAEKLHWILPKEKPTVTLDVFLPSSKVPEFFAWYQEAFRHFPLWCVPYRRMHDYEWVHPGFYQSMGEDQLFIDLAIYGMKQEGDVNYHKLMETKLQELGGIKTLISHNYYTEAEFWQTWNKPNYLAAKARTDPDNIFRDIYTKTCRAARGLE